MILEIVSFHVMNIHGYEKNGLTIFYWVSFLYNMSFKT